MLASPEAARFVLVTHAHLFKPTYPKSKEKLIGTSALFFHQGEYHTRIRKLVQTSLSPETIRKLIPDIETEVVSSLESWVSTGQVINAFQEMKKVGFWYVTIWCVRVCEPHFCLLFVLVGLYFWIFSRLIWYAFIAWRWILFSFVGSLLIFLSRGPPLLYGDVRLIFSYSWPSP